MTAFLFYLLKMVLCSGVLFGYYLLALRNRNFHQWNRFYLLFAVVLSAVLPLCRFTFSPDPLTGADALAFLRSLQQADERLSEIIIVGRQGWSQEQWLTVGYSVICLALLLSLFFSLAKIFNVIRTHEPRRFEQVKLLTTKLAGTPFSFFHYIFWNPDLSLQTETGQQIFSHEVVHVKERHTVDKLFLQLVLVVFWCNPFFWLIRNELRDIHEFIADQKAVGANNAGALAALLLQAAYPTQYSAFTNSFFQTSIKRRLMMLSKKQSLSYAGRILVLPVIAALSFAFTVRSKPTITNLPFANAAVAIDTIPAKEIQSVSVNKNANNNTITITYRDGRKRMFTEAEARKEGLLNEKPNAGAKPATGKNGKPEPLYIVDGEEFTGDLNTIDPNTIESINVWKDKTATEKYGEKGKNGVIEITSKKGANPVTKQSTEPIFERTETPPSVDQQEWRSFLEKASQPIIATAAVNGAKPGTYTVNLRFLVKSDGSLIDFQALNDPGYGLAKKLLESMQDSPKWKPAKQNGKLVSSYHLQPVTFVIPQ